MLHVNRSDRGLSSGLPRPLFRGPLYWEGMGEGGRGGGRGERGNWKTERLVVGNGPENNLHIG